jgi:hypothetical protein
MSSPSQSPAEARGDLKDWVKSQINGFRKVLDDVDHRTKTFTAVDLPVRKDWGLVFSVTWINNQPVVRAFAIPPPRRDGPGFRELVETLTGRFAAIDVVDAPQSLRESFLESIQYYEDAHFKFRRR